MPLTKVTSTMRTGTPLDARSFEQLLAAAYLAQQQREPLPFPSVRPLRDEAERLAALAEAHTIVHGNKLRVQETLQLVAERARRITGGTSQRLTFSRLNSTASAKNTSNLRRGILTSSAEQGRMQVCRQSLALSG